MTLSFEDILSAELYKIKGKKVLVAFSGGKDSLALLDFLNESKDNFSFALHACHINHGLRREASRDEEFCRGFCKARDIPFVSVSIGEKLKRDLSSGTEDAARRHRYAALKETALSLGCDYILTAHTSDDQIESFFTDIYTGASVFTLGGIREKNGMVLRIMLGAGTFHVEDYLARRGLVPVFDRSNNDTKFVRNKIRRKVLPALYEAGGDFVPSVKRIQRDSARLNDYFYKTTFSAVLSDEQDIVEIDAAKFNGFDGIEKEYLLGRIFSGRFRFTKAALEEALKLLDRGGSRRADVGGGYCFEVSFSRIRLFKKFFLDAFLVEKEAGIDTINVSDFRIKFRGGFVPSFLTVRNRRPGDRLPGGKKLKDAFIDRKIDLFDRDRAIVAASGSDILWAEYLDINNEYVEFERFSGDRKRRA